MLVAKKVMTLKWAHFRKEVVAHLLYVSGNYVEIMYEKVEWHSTFSASFYPI